MVRALQRSIGVCLSVSIGAMSAFISTSAGACPTFHTLANGSTADATQVMDDFNSILQCARFTGDVVIDNNIWIRMKDEAGASRTVLRTASDGSVGLNGYHDTAMLLGVNGATYLYSSGGGTSIAALNTNGLTINSSGALGPSSGVGLAVVSGYVGIDTAAPSYPLHVNGTAYSTGAAGALSDIRHKKNVATLEEGALDAVMSLRPVTFEWKEPKDDGMKGKQTGFIAQEIEKVLPSTVLTQSDAMKTKGIKYNELIPVLTKALQEQQEEIRTLKAIEQDRTDEIHQLQTRLSLVEGIVVSPQVSRPIAVSTHISSRGAAMDAGPIQ